MSQRSVTLKKNTSITPCPMCQNNTVFNAISLQVAEDFCDVWVVCKCGYDPTSELWGYRVEDVMGVLDEFTVGNALDVWNDAIAELAKRQKAAPQAN